MNGVGLRGPRSSWGLLPLTLTSGSNETYRRWCPGWCGGGSEAAESPAVVPTSLEPAPVGPFTHLAWGAGFIAC